MNASPIDIPNALVSFPGMASCRVFGPVGSGIPSWSNPAMAALRRYKTVVAWPSFKDWPSDTEAVSMVKAWLGTLPADVPLVYLTYHHEPEGDLPANLYRARWTILANTVRSHPNAARVKLVPIHNWYPARYKVFDRFNPDWSQWVGVWQAWAPTDSHGNYLGDLMGWDCYQPLAAISYEPPASFFRVPVGAAMEAGVPLVIPELGAVHVPSDATGTGRAAWIAACTGYLRQVGATGVNWWHGTGTNGADYRLTDTPSAQAWRDAITTS